MTADEPDHRPIAEVGALTVDGPDAGVLSRFYCRALGAVDDGERNGVYYARLPHLAMCFRSIDDYVPPDWGGSGVGPTRLHLELYVDELTEAHSQLEGLGASTPDYQPERSTGLIVMRDPAGNLFCIFRRSTP